MAAVAASIASFAATPQNETHEGVPARDTVDIRTLTYWTHVLARSIHRSLSSSLELQIDSLHEPDGRVYGTSGGSSSYKRNLRRTAGVSVTSEISWCACSVSTWHAVPISA
jgi:hypothetical protein